MATEKCGQWVGENTAYPPCWLSKGHDGPHSWNPRRREWELEREIEHLKAAGPVPVASHDPAGDA